MVFWTDIYYVFKREFYAVFRDHAVLTFFVALMLGYPVVYTFIYSNEVAREVPVAVVDHAKSALSREFIRNWDATASVDVVARCEDMEAAKLLMYKKGIYGILEIPSDFSKNVAQNATQSNINIGIDNIQMNGVNDPEKFTKQLVESVQQNGKVQSVLKDLTSNALLGKNSLRIDTY